MNLPVEIEVSLITATLAVAGYVGKSAVDWLQERRKKRVGIIAQLQNLEWLLKGSGALFDLQQKKANELIELLEENYKEQLREGVGYEGKMTRCYPLFNDKERVLHGIIRAYTEHSMRTVNLAVSDWLKSDTNFKTEAVPSAQQKDLAEKLFALEIHLMMWHAKYAFWIPNHPEHALVYMGDEAEHGLGFPQGLDEVVSDVLKELRLKTMN
jgi:hypothetical protein